MNPDQINPVPMNEDQLDYVKEQIKQTYLFLIRKKAGHPYLIFKLNI